MILLTNLVTEEFFKKKKIRFLCVYVSVRLILFKAGQETIVKFKTKQTSLWLDYTQKPLEHCRKWQNK